VWAVVALVVLMALVTLMWVHRHYVLACSMTRDPHLEADLHAEPPPDTPLVSVIIPARNERGNIASCIESVLAQKYPNVEIIVADDRSTDGTPEIVEALKREHSNITLVRVKELPAGWTGKCHALFQARKHARGEWLCFIDADTYLAPENLQQVLCECLVNQLDMYTFIPKQVCETFWEKLLQPALGGIFMVRFQLSRVNCPDSKAAFANGQYIFIRSETYDGVGGHETVRGRLLEDIALAHLVKNSGGKLRVAYGKDIISCRMYGTFGQLISGWRRILFAGFDGRTGRLARVLVMTALFSVLPFFTLLGGAVALVAGGMRPWLMALVLFSAAAHTMVLGAFWRLRRVTDISPWLLVLYPVAGVISLGVIASAIRLSLSGNGIEWRGTLYDASGRTDMAGPAAVRDNTSEAC